MTLKKILAILNKGIYVVLLLTFVGTVRSLSIYSFTQTLTVPNSSGDYVILKCEFHMHTTYSDGEYTPSEMVIYYKNHGYDVVAVTDHTSILGWHEGIAEAKATGDSVGVIVIEGGEISFRWADGSQKHVLGLFCHAMDSTNKVTDLTPQEIFEDIHAKGGIGVVAHPWMGTGWNNWQNYQYASYIDGWEYEPYAISSEYRNWLLTSGKIYLFNHDAHGYWLGNSEWGKSHTLLIAKSKSESGVREALEARRIVVSHGGIYYGSVEALELFESLQ